MLECVGKWCINAVCAMVWPELMHRCSKQVLGFAC